MQRLENKKFLSSEHSNPPREFVFRAFTDPKLYSQWLDPRRLTTEFEKLEPKNVGSYRFINEDEKGNKFVFHGVYHEVLTTQRIIGTCEHGGLPEKGHVSLEITKFEELPRGRTKLITQDVFMSVADRDGIVQSGMEEEVNDSYDRLEELGDNEI